MFNPGKATFDQGVNRIVTVFRYIHARCTTFDKKDPGGWSGGGGRDGVQGPDMQLQSSHRRAGLAQLLDRSSIVALLAWQGDWRDGGQGLSGGAGADCGCECG